MNLLGIGMILTVTLITVVGDSLLKKAGGDASYINWKYFFLGLCIYLLTGFLWFFIYKYAKFSISAAVYGVIMTLVFVLVGVFYFKESLRPLEICGILLAITSVFLLSRFSE